MYSTDFNIKIILQAVVNSNTKIEQEIGCRIVFGAVGGSYSLGLQSRNSDIDFYLIVDDEQLVQVVHKKINLLIQKKHVTIDFMCVSYQEILREIERYKSLQKKYPSVKYRTEKEWRENINKGDIDRPDFKRSILFRVLLSDGIINKKLDQILYKKLIEGLKKVDIIDYHYTRIYGNYNEKIKGMDFVPIRKYLYTIHQICTCQYLINCKQKPPMNFVELLNNTMTSELLRNKIYTLFNKNQYALKNKEMELICKDEIINEFVINSINSIKTYLENSMHDNKYLSFDELRIISIGECV